MSKRIYSLIALFAIATTVAADTAATVKKVLVFSRCEGYNHKESIAVCKEKMAEEAKKGAFTVDFSDDYSALEIKNLVKYDALVLNNTTHMKTDQHPFLAPSICSFVRWGGGLCVIHAGADNFYKAPECANLVGGLFDGHPWMANGTWAFKVEDRNSPLTASFKHFPDGKFKRKDEIYQQASPYYDRTKLRVLVSLDMSDEATAKAKGQKRADNDYAVSWIRSYGKGRVFYTSFAHDRRAWEANDTREHIFAGLAYTLGTLKADDTPSAVIEKKENAPSLEKLASEVLDPKKAGAVSDWRYRQKCEFRLAAALFECKDAKVALDVAKRVFARRDVTESLRGVAARVILSSDNSFLASVLDDESKKVRQAAFGYGLVIPNEVLAKAVDGRPSEIKCAIIAKLVENKAKCCVKKIASLTSDGDETVVIAACNALARLGGVENVEMLNDLRKRGGNIGKAAEEALEIIPGAGEKIFDLAKEDKSLLAVAGKRAEVKLFGRWKEFAFSSDKAVRKAAWRGIRNASSPLTQETLTQWFIAANDEEASTAGNILWQSALKSLDENDCEKVLVDIWKKSKGASRMKVEELLLRDKGLKALDVWECLAKDATFGGDAKKAYCEATSQIIKGGGESKALSRNLWKAKASRTAHNDNAMKAIDGDARTRWASGFNAKGASFELDLGESCFVNEVTLNTEKSANDTPAGCEVFVSDDGKNWKGPVATCDDKTKKSTTFSLMLAARYLKFVQVSARKGLYWSIHEVEIKAGMDIKKLEEIKKTAAAFGLKEVK